MKDSGVGKRSEVGELGGSGLFVISITISRQDYNLKEDQGNEDNDLEVTRIIGSGDVDNDI